MHDYNPFILWICGKMKRKKRLSLIYTVTVLQIYHHMSLFTLMLSNDKHDDDFQGF